MVNLIRKRQLSDSHLGPRGLGIRYLQTIVLLASVLIFYSSQRLADAVRTVRLLVAGTPITAASMPGHASCDGPSVISTSGRLDTGQDRRRIKCCGKDQVVTRQPKPQERSSGRDGIRKRLFRQPLVPASVPPLAPPNSTFPTFDM